MNDILKGITRLIELFTIVLLLTWVSLLYQRVGILEEAVKKNAELSINNFVQSAKQTGNDIDMYIQISDIQTRLERAERELSISNKTTSNPFTPNLSWDK